MNHNSRTIPNHAAPPQQDRTARAAEESDLRAAIQYAVISCCGEAEAAEERGSTTTGAAQMTSRALTALAELTYLYATTSLSADLDAFCQHAGRRTITQADVQLVARKNPDGLLDKLHIFLADTGGTTTTTTLATDAKTRKKRAPPTRPVDLQSGTLATTSAARNPYEAGSDDDSSSSDDGVLVTTAGKNARRIAVPMDACDSSDDDDVMDEGLGMARSSGSAKTSSIHKPLSAGARKKPLSLDFSSDDDDDATNTMATTLRRNAPQGTKPATAAAQTTFHNRAHVDLDSSDEENVKPAASAPVTGPGKKSNVAKRKSSVLDDDDDCSEDEKLLRPISKSDGIDLPKKRRSVLDDEDLSEDDLPKPTSTIKPSALPPPDKRLRFSLKTANEKDDSNESDDDEDRSQSLLSPSLSSRSAIKSSTLQILDNLSDDSHLSEHEEVEDLV